MGGAALVVGLAGGEGVGDAEVAGDQGGGGEQRDWGESHQSAPAAGEVVGGAVGEGGEGAFGGGAAVVGEAVLAGGVAVFLRGFGVDGGWYGDRLLGAADGRGLGRGEDRGVVVRERDRGGSVWAAEFSLGGGAADAAVPVGVVAGDW